MAADPPLQSFTPGIVGWTLRGIGQVVSRTTRGPAW